LHKYIQFVNVLVGADYRLYDLIPDGNNFVDFNKTIDKRNTPGGKNIHYGKVGGFVQVAKPLLDEKLALTASLRLDKNTEYDAKLNPRFSAVYTLNKIHTFRASWQNGFRFPSLFEAFSFVNNGGVRRVGGLPIVERGLNYYSNAALSSSVTAYTNEVNILRNATPGLSLTEAALQASNLLKVGNAAQLKPEQINSFEVGYRASLFNNKLFIDAEGYFNSYKYFIGQLENAVPKSGNINNFNDTTVLKSLYNNSNDTRYRVQANSQSPVKNYGFAFGVTYNIYKTYSASFNANYNKLSQTNPNDPLIPGFNTPNWATNFSFGNREVTKHVGFNVVWHYQNSFYWQNLFGNGNISAYHTVDAQVTYSAPKINSSFKLGGTDILNHKYSQYIGGPTISALYYVTWVLDDLFK
ncbi:MAG: TonB-dependent receptor, partial [Bacteroidota bacterium]|nr:TonB-dependent receptor [Bacteroidota bacterium]